MLNTMWQQCKT